MGLWVFGATPLLVLLTQLNVVGIILLVLGVSSVVVGSWIQRGVRSSATEQLPAVGERNDGPCA